MREIADALDDAAGGDALALIIEANDIVQQTVVLHERQDEIALYPKLSAQLADASGLAAMSRAHREIQHLARLLMRLSSGLSPEDADRYLIRDAQRAIELIESLVRLHNAQEEDIYEHAGAAERAPLRNQRLRECGKRGRSCLNAKLFLVHLSIMRLKRKALTRGGPRCGKSRRAEQKTRKYLSQQSE